MGYALDESRWKQAAQVQKHGTQWCYAAALASIVRYKLPTLLVCQEHFVYLALGRLDEKGRLEWQQYMGLCDRLEEDGIVYARSGGKESALLMKGDYKPGFDEAMIVGALRDDRPAICTIRYEDAYHDLVIIGVETSGEGKVTQLRYWNPADGGIASYSRDGFVRDFTPLCIFTFAVVTDTRATVPRCERCGAMMVSGMIPFCARCASQMQ